MNKHYKVISEVFNSIDAGINQLSNMQYTLLGSIEEGIGSILYYFFLVGAIIVLSMVSKGVRVSFIHNLSIIVLNAGV